MPHGSYDCGQTEDGAPRVRQVRQTTDAHLERSPDGQTKAAEPGSPAPQWPPLRPLPRTQPMPSGLFARWPCGRVWRTDVRGRRTRLRSAHVRRGDSIAGMGGRMADPGGGPDLTTSRMMSQRWPRDRGPRRRNGPRRMRVACRGPRVRQCLPMGRRHHRVMRGRDLMRCGQAPCCYLVRWRHARLRGLNVGAAPDLGCNRGGVCTRRGAGVVRS
jgi:hypothetical protein